MNINPIGPYYAGALKTAIASCFINGKITEQQIDFVKEVVSKFREAGMDHLTLSDFDRKGNSCLFEGQLSKKMYISAQFIWKST